MISLGAILRTFHIDKAGWYILAQDRQEWHRCKGGSSVNSTARDGRFYCDGCQCSFSRSQDKARQSCDSVRSHYATGTVSAPVPRSHCWRTFASLRIWQGINALNQKTKNQKAMEIYQLGLP